MSDILQTAPSHKCIQRNIIKAVANLLFFFAGFRAAQHASDVSPNQPSRLGRTERQKQLQPAGFRSYGAEREVFRNKIVFGGRHPSQHQIRDMV